MTYRVMTSRRVDREIGQIARWYFDRSGSEQVADEWVVKFHAAAATLATQPDRCPLARESAAFDFEVRELLYGSGRKKTHRILFRINDDESVIEVIGVRHFAQRDLAPDEI